MGKGNKEILSLTRTRTRRRSTLSIRQIQSKMTLSNKQLDLDWEALAAKEAAAVAHQYQRPLVGASAVSIGSSSSGGGGRVCSPLRYTQQRTSAALSGNLPLTAGRQSVRSAGGGGGGRTATALNASSSTANKGAAGGDGYSSSSVQLQHRGGGNPNNASVLSSATSTATRPYMNNSNTAAGTPPNSSFPLTPAGPVGHVADSNASTAEVFNAEGAIFKVPSADFPTLEDAVSAARNGDCIFLEPIVFDFTETLLISRSIHLIGVDEVGACAVLRMSGGTLKPPLPILRLSGANVHLKGLKLEYSHDVERASVDALSQSHAVLVSEGGTAVMDEVSILSSCGGVRGTPQTKAVPGGKSIDAAATYISATCCKFQCDTTAVHCEGNCFIDRCTIAVGARGVAVQDGATARVEGSGFVGGAIGVDVQRRGRAHIERNAFVSVAIGVNIFNGLINIPQPSVIRGNEFRSPMEAGIRVDGEGASADVTKNLIHAFNSGEAVAIEVSNGKPEIKSNVIKDCVGTSINLLGGAALIESNVLELGRIGIFVKNSRPTIRLNEICLQQEVGIKVQSSAPMSMRNNPNGVNIIGGGRRGTGANPATDDSSVNVSAISDANTTTATTTTPMAAPPIVIHPLSEADPHVEANSFHDNHTNLHVDSVTGTFLKNDFGATEGDNIILDGPLVVPIVLSGNTIAGSRDGCGVLASNGTEAHITDNDVSHAKVACIMLRGSLFVEVKQNAIHDAQTAFIAMNRSVGKFSGNEIDDGMTVDVYTDSQPTVTVVQ